MNRLSTEARARILGSLVEGMSIRAICRTQGVGKNTVARLIRDLGDACADYTDGLIRGLRCEVIQCDEVWSFIYAKDRNVPQDMRDDPNVGSVWTWTAIDAKTKLMISWRCGTRSEQTGQPFMDDIAARVVNRPQVNTDGLAFYRTGVVAAFGWDNVDHARIEKRFAPSTTSGRYSPPHCIGMRKVRQHGRPNMAAASTSHVERANLTIRMGVRRFTRLTNAHSKSYDQHVAMLSIFFAYYNLCRKHEGVGNLTPAQAAKLTDRRWSLEDLAGLLDQPKPLS